MLRPFLRPDRRAALWMTLVCGLLLLSLLTACGGAGGSGSQSPITITETTGGNDVYAFSPTTISLKVGDSLKFTNNSDENHKLAITPAGPTAGTVTRSGSNDNT